MLQIAPAAINNGRPLDLPTRLLILVIATILAAITYHLLENPMRNLAFLKTHRPAWSWALGLLLVLLPWGISSGYIAANQLPSAVEIQDFSFDRYPTTDEVSRAVAAAVTDPGSLQQEPTVTNPAFTRRCGIQRAANTSVTCDFGDVTSDFTVAVVGDSHAAMWMPAFDNIGRAKGWHIIQIAKAGCPLIDMPVYSTTHGTTYDACALHHDWTFQQLDTIQPDVIIVTNAYRGVSLATNGQSDPDGTPAAWEAGLSSTLTRLQGSTKQLVVLGDFAYAEGDDQQCIDTHPNAFAECASQMIASVPAESNAIEERVADGMGVPYVSVIPYFCADTLCPAVINGLPVRRDGAHVSPIYAIWLSNALYTDLTAAGVGK